MLFSGVKILKRPVMSKIVKNLDYNKKDNEEISLIFKTGIIYPQNTRSHCKSKKI